MMERFPNKQKAIDLALWRNYSYRYGDYSVALSPKNDYIVVRQDDPSFAKKEFENLPKDYADISYEQIHQIATDREPLDHWEEIRGMFSIQHGELLHFILNTKLPLEKFIRWELACRGYDEQFQWVGFDKSEEIWLK